MANAHPHLAHAPIAEASIDIQVDAPDLTSEGLGAMFQDVKDVFPEKHDRVEYQFGIDASHAPRNDQKQVGWLAWSVDHSRAIQARPDGFTFSRLPKYQDWSDLRDGARREWGKYAAVAKPRVIRRIGVRFINRIELPRSLNDFEDYFQTFPKIGPTIPQKLVGAFARLLIPFDRAIASVTQTFDASSITDTIIPVVLDIDVFLNAEFDPNGDEFWENLDRLRHIKNEVFFGSITEKTKEMFL
jgi:uncharacterized protein (TIGR04255 family)